jgi:hypothetical protein
MLGLFLLAGRTVGLQLGLCQRIGCGLTFILQTFLIYFFDRDGAGIFRGLDDFTGHPDHGFTIAMFGDGIFVDLVH